MSTIYKDLRIITLICLSLWLLLSSGKCRFRTPKIKTKAKSKKSANADRENCRVPIGNALRTKHNSSKKDSTTNQPIPPTNLLTNDVYFFLNDIVDNSDLPIPISPLWTKVQSKGSKLDADLLQTYLKKIVSTHEMTFLCQQLSTKNYQLDCSQLIKKIKCIDPADSTLMNIMKKGDIVAFKKQTGSEQYATVSIPLFNSNKNIAIIEIRAFLGWHDILGYYPAYLCVFQKAKKAQQHNWTLTHSWQIAE